MGWLWMVGYQKQSFFARYFAKILRQAVVNLDEFLDPGTTPLLDRSVHVKAPELT